LGANTIDKFVLCAALNKWNNTTDVKEIFSFLCELGYDKANEVEKMSVMHGT